MVKDKFDAHFVKRTKVIYERAMFNRRVQEDGETVDAFITALYAQAEKYGTLKEEMIRDRIVVGIKDSAVSLKLQLDPKLTLETAVTQARDTETVKRQQPLIRDPEEKDREVNAFQKGKPSRKAFENKKRSDSKSSCSRCGRSPNHDKQHCPAKDSKCHKCGKQGHFKFACRTKHIQGVQGDFFLGAVQSNKEARWTVELCLNSTPTVFQIDTGAEVSLVSEQDYRRAGSPPLTPVHQTFRGPKGYIIPVKGRFKGLLQKDGRKVEQDIYVVKTLHKPLLGQPAIEALEIVKQIDQVQASKLDPTKQFPELFQSLGKLQTDYTIKLQEDAKPFAITVPRRVPVPLRKKVKAELDRMEAQGVNQQGH